MAIMGMIAGAVIGIVAALSGVWLGVWLVRRLDAQSTMPSIFPQMAHDIEPEAPLRSPDLSMMWPQKEKGDADGKEQ